MSEKVKGVCRKCGAGRSSIAVRRELQGDGRTHLVACCVLCGWRIHKDEPPPPRRLVMAHPGHACWTYVPCPVQGCRNQVVPERSGSGICTTCGGQLRAWQRGRRKTLPLLKVNGYWFRAPEALIPGD